MGTRSHVAVKYKSGKVKCVYLHQDGYPSNAGLTLYLRYNTPRKAKQLVNMGNIWSIDKRLSPRKKLDYRAFDYDKKEPLVEHGKEYRHEGVCAFYHRDFGHKKEVMIFDTLEEAREHDFTYVYIESENRWVFCSYYNSNFRDLEYELQDLGLI